MRYTKQFFLFFFLISGATFIPVSAQYNVQLRQVNEIALPSTPIDIAIDENNLYLICSNSEEGVIIKVDITSPENVQAFSIYSNLAVNPFSFAFSGSYCYIA